MTAREADYLRFASELQIPFDNNPAEQVVRMSKLRIKGLRLHALDARSRDLLPDPLLSRHHRPPRQQLARRPYPGLQRHPWIPQNRINQPGTKAPPTKAITGTYLVTSELRPIRRSASACLLNSVVVVDPVLPIIGRRSASSYALCGGRSGASSLRKIPLRQASSQNTRSTWKTRKKASARQEHDQHLGHGRLVPSKMLCLDLHGISTPI